MKKLHIITILLMSAVFLLSACSGRSSYPMAMPTVMPIQVNHIDISDRDEDSNNDKEISAKEAAFEESFESLRQTALYVCPTEPSFEASVYRNLINYDDNTIILAELVAMPGQEGDIYSNIDANASYTTLFCYASALKIIDGELIESDVVFQPILISFVAGTTTKEIKEIYIPDMYDLDKRAEDIKNIFGVDSEEELGFKIDDPKLLNALISTSKKNISSMKYHIALEGGFDGFPNDTLKILNDIINSEYFDTSTSDGAINAYYLENMFSYSSLTIPIIIKSLEETNVDSTRVFTGTYFETIHGFIDGRLDIGECTTITTVLDLALNDGIYLVTSSIEINADGQERIGLINEYMGDDATNFINTIEFTPENTEAFIQSILDGTYTAD